MLARFSAIALISLFATQAQAALSIDDFDTLQSQAGVGTNTVAAAEALGGFRTLTITSITPNNLSATLAVGPAPLGLSLSNDAGESSISHVTWDANGAGLGGVDLTQGGLINNFFDLKIASIDVGAIDLKLTVEDTGAGVSSVDILGATVGNAIINFASFVGTADFTSVDSITLMIDAGINKDLSIDYIHVCGEVIPEPTSAAVFGLLGLIGFSVRRRAASVC